MGTWGLTHTQGGHLLTSSGLCRGQRPNGRRNSWEDRGDQDRKHPGLAAWSGNAGLLGRQSDSLSGLARRPSPVSSLRHMGSWTQCSLSAGGPQKAASSTDTSLPHPHVDPSGRLSLALPGQLLRQGTQPRQSAVDSLWGASQCPCPGVRPGRCPQAGSQRELQHRQDGGLPVSVAQVPWATRQRAWARLLCGLLTAKGGDDGPLRLGGPGPGTAPLGLSFLLVTCYAATLLMR